MALPLSHLKTEVDSTLSENFLTNETIRYNSTENGKLAAEGHNSAINKPIGTILLNTRMQKNFLEIPSIIYSTLKLGSSSGLKYSGWSTLETVLLEGTTG